jgi:NAD(P)-dependent dehydrogenase (short-subunit alcohol dehydrogenase family)
MSSFEGKVVIVTGAARGQGAAEAQAFAAAGASVVICDVLDEPGEQLATEIRRDGGAAEYRHLDVSSQDGWSATIAVVAEAHGRLDVLINNAGVALRGRTLATTTLEEWNRLLSINLTGAFLGIQAAAALMARSGGGAIINIGSIAGMTGHFATAYSTAKWGMRGLTKSAAMELAADGIRVLAVHPGLVMTPIVDGSDGFVAAMEEMTPMSRGASVDEIAAVVLFLASDEASFITGIDVPVDGGFTEAGAYRQVVRRAKAIGQI